MANAKNYNYEKFDVPYNNYLERSDTIPSTGIANTYGDDLIQNPGNIGENVLDGQSIDNLEIKSWIKSANYRPKTHGFIIDGKLGYIECMQLYVGSGGIIGGSLDIPDYTTADSFHVDSSGNMWSGINTSGPITSAPAYILNDGTAKFTNVIIYAQPGSTGIGNYSDAGDLALQDDITDGQAPTSLRGWIQNLIWSVLDYNTVSWSAGTIKFSDGSTVSLNAGNTGNMATLTYIYFDGTSTLKTTTNYSTVMATGRISVAVAYPNSDPLKKAAYQCFGGSGNNGVYSIITADNIAANTITANEIDANYIYTNTLEAQQIISGTGLIANLTVKSTLTMGNASTVGYIQSYGWNGTAAGYQLGGGVSPTFNLIGGTITGGTIQTAPINNNRMVLNTSNLTGYDNPGIDSTDKRMQLDREYLEFYRMVSGTSRRTFRVDDAGITFYNSADGVTPWVDINLALGWFSIATYGKHLYLTTDHKESDNSYHYIQFSSVDPNTSVSIPMVEIHRDTINNVSLLQMNGPAYGGSRIETSYLTLGTGSNQGYLNFAYQTALIGLNGYGIREDVSGNIQYRHYGGAWTTMSVGSSYSATSLGTYDIYYQLSGTQFQFRGLSAGTGISLSYSGNDVQAAISLSAGSNISVSGNQISLVSNPIVSGIRAASFDVDGSATITWDVGYSNVVFDTEIYVYGSIKSSASQVILGGNTYGRYQVSAPGTNIDGLYILASST